MHAAIITLSSDNLIIYLLKRKRIVYKLITINNRAPMYSITVKISSPISSSVHATSALGFSGPWTMLCCRIC